MNEGRRTILVDDDDWSQLQKLAGGIVHDSEMPKSSNRSAGRVSAMLRLIARGELVVRRDDQANHGL